MGLGGGLPKTLCTTLFLYLTLATIIVGIDGQGIQSCASNLLPSSSVPKIFSYVYCQQVQVAGVNPTPVYNLWYKRDNTTSPVTLTVILGVPRENRWYGMGFNQKENSMAGTKALIFWLNPTTSVAVWGTYALSKPDISGVTPDSTILTFTKNKEPQVFVETNTLYLAYEVIETTESDFAFQNFVLGHSGDVPSGNTISGQVQHDGESSVQINFVTGSGIVTTVNVNGERRTHGVLNIIGYGVLLPLGAIVARYARVFDPHWFYVHAFSQIVGYGFVMAGLITGTKLLDKLPGVDAGNHRSLAISLFVLASIQISAVLIRPKKEAKLRRYWNWSHWWLGRVALVIGAANIFVGIHLAKASRKWTVAYGVILALELFAVVILEILLWINYSRSEDEPRLPQTAMQNRDSNGASAPPVPYETNWDGKP